MEVHILEARRERKRGEEVGRYHGFATIIRYFYSQDYIVRARVSISNTGNDNGTVEPQYQHVTQQWMYVKKSDSPKKNSGSTHPCRK